MYTVGIDIGGTKTRVALVKGSKEIESLKIFDTSKSLEETILKISKVINCWKNKQIKGIGLCCPGPMDIKKGKILNPPNLPEWHNKEIIKMLVKETKINNIKMDNDANLAALGEYLSGEAKGQEIVQFFTISTGFGAGLVINGKILSGANGHAQEIQNTVLIDKETGYSDLPNGSIESFASGTGILNQAIKNGLKVRNTKEVFDLYNKNLDAKKVIDQAIIGISRIIVISISNFDPSSIVFSGSVALNNPWIIEEAYKKARILLPECVRGNTNVHISKLKGLGAIIGAAALI